MDGWQRSKGSALVFAHISDLHFGHKDQDRVWNGLTTYLRTVAPDAVLCTGDVVDSPNERLFEEASAALRALLIPTFVCAGNHDRHWHGNRLFRRATKGLAFAHYFDGMYVGHKGITFRKHVGGRPISIAIFGGDTSVSAKYLAQGYMEPADIAGLESEMTARDGYGTSDLVFVLVHHHPQPVRFLEERRAQSPKSIANVLAFMNATSFLESMTRVGTDIIFHGHEHCINWSRYGSLEGVQNDVAIVGAASASGAASVGPCKFDDASINIVEVSDTFDVMLTVVRWQAMQWSATHSVRILDGDGVRKRQVYREDFVTKFKPTATQAHEGQQPIPADVIKAVRFTSNRDVYVTSIYPWQVPPKMTIGNSIGSPSHIGVDVTLDDGKCYSLAVKTSVPPPPKAGTVVEWEYPKDAGVREIEVRYCFPGGGLLWHEDLLAAQKNGQADPIQKQGFEHISFRVPSTAPALVFSVLLPAEADPDVVKIIVKDKDDNYLEAESQRAKRLLRKLGPGHYLLRIPYPRKLWYALAWAPRPRPRTLTKTTDGVPATHDSDALPLVQSSDDG